MSQLKDIVYLDNNATTPLDARVFDAMRPYFVDYFGNASSIDHMHGSKAAEAVASARNGIANAIGARANEIVFTSGATESNNLAISGVMGAYESAGNHMITCSTEHESVLHMAKHMEGIGKKVTYMPVDEYGIIDLGELRDAITDRTVLISIMTANNEIGTIQDVTGIGNLAHEHNVLFHTDAAQAVGHIPMNVKQMNIDLLSFSAHKMYGPKGIGALYVRGINPMIKLVPMLHGGGQERNMRSGTLNVPAIVGFGKAVEIAERNMRSEELRFRKWSEKILDALSGSRASLNGHPVKRLAHNLNICFSGIEGKAIINSISKHVAISAGSACTASSVEPSHVLLALGLDENSAHSSIRIGMGRFNTNEDIDCAITSITEAVKSLKNIQA